MHKILEWSMPSIDLNGPNIPPPHHWLPRRTSGSAGALRCGWCLISVVGRLCIRAHVLCFLVSTLPCWKQVRPCASKERVAPSCEPTKHPNNSRASPAKHNAVNPTKSMKEVTPSLANLNQWYASYPHLVDIHTIVGKLEAASISYLLWTIVWISMYHWFLTFYSTKECVGTEGGCRACSKPASWVDLIRS